MKHTKGPWEISRGAQNYPYSIESETKTIAFIKMQTALSATDLNARLIAAAPELLEALWEVKRGIANGIKEIELQAICDVAILKTRGSHD